MDSGNAQIGPQCFREFMQATSFNKRMIMRSVMDLNNEEPRDQANYEVALKYAFTTFEKVAFMFCKVSAYACFPCCRYMYMYI